MTSSLQCFLDACEASVAEGAAEAKKVKLRPKAPKPDVVERAYRSVHRILALEAPRAFARHGLDMYDRVTYEAFKVAMHKAWDRELHSIPDAIEIAAAAVARSLK